MSELRKRYCVFGCDALVAHGVPLHRFPNPDKHSDLFAAWIAAGHKLLERDPKKIYKNKRICDHHFEPTFKTTGGHLICTAIPTVNLNRVQQSISTFVETDHSYCCPRRESGHVTPLVDITSLPVSSFQPGPSKSGSLFPVDSAEFSVPSGSTSTTCLTTSEMCPDRQLTKFDADKIFKYLQKKAEIQCARKIRQMQNEIRILRQKLKNYKLRLQQIQKKAANRNFEKFAQNMSESATLLTRMQCIGGRKKKKRT